MSKSTKKNTLFAILFFVIGVLVAAMAIGLIPVDEADVKSPMWVFYLVSMVFMIAGVMIIIGRKNRYNDLLAALLITAMGAIGGWVAVYSDSSGISGGIFLLPRESNVMLGRIAFGTGSLICFAIAAWALKRFFRRGGG